MIVSYVENCHYKLSAMLKISVEFANFLYVALGFPKLLHLKLANFVDPVGILLHNLRTSQHQAQKIVELESKKSEKQTLPVHCAPSKRMDLP